jgi:anti-anti-sigma regulatory factor
MQAIVRLGEQGLLDEPTSETGPELAVENGTPSVRMDHQEVDMMDATGVGVADDTKAL